MKYMKILGLAAVAAMALMAFVASSASATVLTSPAGTVLPAGTVVEATLKGSAVLEETGGTTLDTCTGSTVSGKTSTASGTPLTGNIETLDWSNCIVPTKTFVNGSLSVEATSQGNGTVSGSESKVTVGIFGVSCIYGTGTAVPLGTVTGGEPATVDINAVIHLQEGGILCPTTTKWTATYTITKPNPLFVS
jgi:hypothetical protein